MLVCNGGALHKEESKCSHLGPLALFISGFTFDYLCVGPRD